VIVATPWLWHVPMALAAMKHGKHVGVEVPAAKTIADCWALVNTSEGARRHCIQLENCCYGYNEMLVLNMVKAGSSARSPTAPAPTTTTCAASCSPTKFLLLKPLDASWRRGI
jgi:hypothetical protein